MIMEKSLDRLKELSAAKVSTWHEEADWYSSSEFHVSQPVPFGLIKHTV